LNFQKSCIRKSYDNFITLDFLWRFTSLVLTAVTSREVKRRKEWNVINAAAATSKEMPKRPVRKPLRVLNPASRNTARKIVVQIDFFNHVYAVFCSIIEYNE